MIDFNGIGNCIDNTSPNVCKILKSVKELTKLLIKEKIITPKKWHTVKFYTRTNEDGFFIEEFKVYRKKIKEAQ